MIQFPNCKINLGLSILEKRTDGFHALETIFYPVALNDLLEITATSGHQNEMVQFTSSGNPIPGDVSGNLCVKAYQVLKADFPQLSPVKIHLHKKIPIGAGLGGGSSDGANALIMLNDLFKLYLSKNQLLDYAAMLGSDCPFFILNEACHATGRGEIMQTIPIHLEHYTIALIHPNISISTGWAFQQIKPCKKEKTIAEIIQQPITTWKNELINDFEKPVFDAHPTLLQIKNDLYHQGALYASLSGSGSSLFGLFPKGITWNATPSIDKLQMDLI
ncbi:MAG: 4-(cytidine 5'-diphospho)-2-C-methyl-D-erythritol kinase [Chitinophagia bacterium]|jgi:4-diphosphocytidyl-2-C-methyl-D-erythritol kinase